YIGTEHLLMGLLTIGEGIAWQVLTGEGVTVAATRAHIERMIGCGSETPHGHIPFTPRSNKVLHLALGEALQLGHNYVGTEHVLLAIEREGEGVGWQILALQGLKGRALRKAVQETLGGVVRDRSQRAQDETPKPSEVTSADIALRLSELEARISDLEGD
ncbi:MAG: Clp protease N-terminal domain-containing protein, partial [Actinomycetota bacterium]